MNNRLNSSKKIKKLATAQLKRSAPEDLENQPKQKKTAGQISIAFLPMDIESIILNSYFR